MPHFTRRRFLGASFAAAAASALTTDRVARALGLSHAAAQAENSCITTPEQETGPFYIADEMLRAEIAEGKPGVPLTLRILVLEAGTCKPIPNAAVDIWHCDALGIYSGFTKMSFGPPPDGGPRDDFRPVARRRCGPPQATSSERCASVWWRSWREFTAAVRPRCSPPTNLLFAAAFRSAARTAASCSTQFFPGFYQGRTNHIHFKVRIGDTFSSVQSSQQGIGRLDNPTGHVSHTGQIFFDEADAVTLMKRAPYNEHKIHRVTQSEDGVFNQQHGSVSIARMHLGTEDQIRGGLGAASRSHRRSQRHARADPSRTRGIADPAVIRRIQSYIRAVSLTDRAHSDRRCVKWHWHTACVRLPRPANIASQSVSDRARSRRKLRRMTAGSAIPRTSNAFATRAHPRRRRLTN